MHELAQSDSALVSLFLKFGLFRVINSDLNYYKFPNSFPILITCLFFNPKYNGIEIADA